MYVVHTFTPVALATAMGTVALVTLPVYIADYRANGVLRRLSTTPMRPQGVLVAHVVINIVAVVVASALAITAALLVFGSPMPQQPLLGQDRKSTRLNSSHVASSYAVFCFKKKKDTVT